MSDTLGSLVDKLAVTNIKLFMVQDEIHAAAKQGIGLDADTTKKLVDLNLQRNKLMSEIDEVFAKGLATGLAEVDPRVKII